jgi:hypothetical protein
VKTESWGIVQEQGGRRGPGAVVIVLGILGVVALVFALVWFVFLRAQPRDLSGHVSLTGTCPPAHGLSVVVLDPPGLELGSGSVTPETTPDGCDLDFAFPVDQADAYVFVIRVDVGTETRDAVGPTLSPNDLVSNAWDVALQATQFERLEIPGMQPQPSPIMTPTPIAPPSP